MIYAESVFKRGERQIQGRAQNWNYKQYELSILAITKIDMQNAEVYFDANVFPTSCFTSPFLFLSTVFLNYFVKLFWKSLDIYKI